MKFLSLLRKHSVPIVLIAASIMLLYKDLPNTFFQQDEWWTFGNFIAREQKGGIGQVFIESMITGAKIHVNPIADLGMYAEYKTFGMNFSGYAIVGIILQVVNAILIYWLATLLFHRKLVGFFIAILFSLSSISHQSVSWISANIPAQGSIILSLLFAIFYLEYLMKKRRDQALLILAILFMFLTLLVKEIALPFFLLPVFAIFYSKEKNSLTRAQIRVIGILAFFYLLYRVVAFFLAPAAVVYPEMLIQPNPLTYLYRIATLPFKVLPESLIPTEWLLTASRTFIKLFYPHFVSPDGSVNPYLAETAGLDMVLYVTTMILGAIAYFSFRLLKRHKELQRGIILAFIFIVGSAFLIVLLPGKAGYASILEPRYLYGATIGGSMLIVFILYSFVMRIKTAVLKKILFFFPIFVIVIIHVFFVQMDLGVLVARSNLRREFLTTIQRKYPLLPKRVILYTQSDRPYYGMPDEEKILPVQVGFGRMLLVWYQNTERFPACFYEGPFLLDLLAQGYKECGGRGFGYFRHYDKLVAALQEHKLSPEDVIAYDWNGKTGKFASITDDIRRRLEASFVLP